MSRSWFVKKTQWWKHLRPLITLTLQKHVSNMKYKLVITEQADYSRPEEGVIRCSNSQWLAQPHRLEGYEFGDVIVKCVPESSMARWLHMHLGIRIDRIIYE